MYFQDGTHRDIRRWYYLRFPSLTLQDQFGGPPQIACIMSGPLYPNTLSVLWSRRWTLVSLVTVGRLSFDHDKIQRVE